MPYKVFLVPTDASTQLEQLGTKAKFWFRAENGTQVLFKEGRPGTGENWAEKACCELAQLLGLPHAQYDLAVWRNKNGVVTNSLIPPNGRLILGNELLAKIHPSYDASISYKSGQHTLRRALAVLRSELVNTPNGWDCPDEVSNAVGVFIGYLMLDALVGNQDRHHENWALINSPQTKLYLAPTYDHASSLGRNETDENRIRRLETKDGGYSIESYVMKARSGFYDSSASTRPMSTMDAFLSSSRENLRAAEYWRGQLEGLGQEDFSGILNQVPNEFITQPARDFACKMLNINRNILLRGAD